MVTRLLLVDDHALVREGVAKLLSDHEAWDGPKTENILTAFTLPMCW